MKKASLIVTGFFALYFIYRIVKASQIHTSYGNMALSIPYVFGVLLACSIIPGIMWLITYLLKNNKNDSNPIRIEYKKVDENPETKALVDKKEKLEIKLMDIKGKYNLLKQALDSSLIDKSKFDCKMNELNLDKQDIEEQLKNIKHRIYALDILKDQFNSLDELVKNGILSIEEKLSKREELIIKIISNLE